MNSKKDDMLNTLPKGTVFWITGLSGAGKTTIGNQFWKLVKKTRPGTVFLDGDKLREIMGRTNEYDPQARLELAMQYCRLCKMLSDQGLDVICATISMFKECWCWNRNNIINYKEIYIKVSMEILIERDQKKLYSRALNSEISHVMGIDIPLEEPWQPDLIIENNGDYSPADLAQKIYDTIT